MNKNGNQKLETFAYLLSVPLKLIFCLHFFSFAIHPFQKSLKDLKIEDLTPLTPEVISKQATINIGTIGHVAHGKSTVVKAISGVQTVRFKNELERNITIKLGTF